MSERHYLVAVDGLRATFECPRGHRYEIDYERKPIARRPSAWWLKRMLSYWSRENNGVSVDKPCPTCAKVI